MGFVHVFSYTFFFLILFILVASVLLSCQQSCFLHGLSREICGDEHLTPLLRVVCHLYGSANIHLFPNAFFTDDVPAAEYMRRIAVPNTWCDHVEILIMAQVLGWRIEIFNGSTTTVVEPMIGGFTHTITLLYSNNNHYDLAAPSPLFVVPPPAVGPPPEAFAPPSSPSAFVQPCSSPASPLPAPDLHAIELALRRQLARQIAAAEVLLW
jgi:hypothetical protein